MEDKKVFIFGAKAGLIVAVAMIIITFVTFFMDIDTTGWWTQLLLTVVRLLLVMLSVFIFAKFIAHSQATLLHILAVTLTLGFVYFIIFYIFEAVYINWIDSEYLNRLVAHKMLGETDISYEQTNAIRLKQEALYAFSIGNFVKQFFFIFIQYSAIGLGMAYLFGKKQTLIT